VAPESPAARHRVALLVTAVLVVAGLILLPRTLQSLAQELLGEPLHSLYQVTPERTIVPVRPDRRPQSALYANIAVAGIDEATRVATLRLSGNRACSPTCPATRLLFFALQDDAAERWALPASATVTLPENTAVLSDTVHLPVRVLIRCERGPRFCPETGPRPAWCGYGDQWEGRLSSVEEAAGTPVPPVGTP
jgi:hypothetical protein